MVKAITPKFHPDRALRKIVSLEGVEEGNGLTGAPRNSYCRNDHVCGIVIESPRTLPVSTCLSGRNPPHGATCSEYAYRRKNQQFLTSTGLACTITIDSRFYHSRRMYVQFGEVRDEWGQIQSTCFQARSSSYSRPSMRNNSNRSLSECRRREMDAHAMKPQRPRATQRLMNLVSAATR